MTHRGREAPGGSTSDVGAHVHGKEAHQLRGAEQAHGHGLAQDGGEVSHGAYPLRQHRPDGEGVVLLGNGRAQEPPPALPSLSVPSLTIIITLVKVVVVIAPVVTAPSACVRGCVVSRVTQKKG